MLHRICFSSGSQILADGNKRIRILGRSSSGSAEFGGNYSQFSDNTSYKRAWRHIEGRVPNTDAIGRDSLAKDTGDIKIFSKRA